MMLVINLLALCSRASSDTTNNDAGRGRNGGIGAGRGGGIGAYPTETGETDNLSRNLSSSGPDIDCYTGKGKHYKGIESFTKTFQECKAWTGFLENKQIIDRNFPEGSVKGAHHYCRNPDERRTGPWCFNYRNEQETCQIRRCGGGDGVQTDKNDRGGGPPRGPPSAGGTSYETSAGGTSYETSAGAKVAPPGIRIRGGTLEDCGQVVNYVCASDGNTYGNDCWVRKNGLTVSKRGPCNDFNYTPSISRPTGTIAPPGIHDFNYTPTYNNNGGTSYETSISRPTGTTSCQSLYRSSELCEHGRAPNFGAHWRDTTATRNTYSEKCCAACNTIDNSSICSIGRCKWNYSTSQCCTGEE